MAEEIKLFDDVLALIVDNRLVEAGKMINQFIATKKGNVSPTFSHILKMVEYLAAYKCDSILYHHLDEYRAVYQDITEKYKPENYFQNSNVATELNSDFPIKRDIWWCWLQGLKKAPLLVQACYNSLSCLDRPIHIITSSNFSDYVKIPQYVIDKWHQGIISDAHFSDILRLELLTTWGGIWIDATVLVTNNTFKSYLDEYELFCFKNIMRGIESHYVVASNWMISSSSNHPILEETKRMLLRYWEEENTLKHYFLFHLFFTFATKLHSEYWKSVPTVSNVPCHIMQEELFFLYSEKRWKQLCNMSDFHKLTYKDIHLKPKEKLIYNYILEKYL